MVLEFSLPLLGTIIVSALIDSLNPCTLGVLILLISAIVSGTYSKKQILKTGIVFVLVVYAVYFAASLGLMFFLGWLPPFVADYFFITAGALLVIGGLLEIKEFFWYGRGVSLGISLRNAKKIEGMAQNFSITNIILLGLFVAAVEFPCAGGPHIAVAMILSQDFGALPVLLLALYNAIFVLPLLVIVLLAFFGIKIQEIKMWKHANRAHMRLANGILLVLLGWLLLLIAGGIIHFW